MQPLNGLTVVTLEHANLNMLQTMAEWMGYPLHDAHEGEPLPPRGGAAHVTIYPSGTVPCGDSKTVMLGLQNERDWPQFCTRVLQQPALTQDAHRTAHRTALRAAGVN